MKILHCLRIPEFIAFSKEFFLLLSLIRGVIVSLFLLIGIGGVVLSRVEGIAFREGQYLAFVTALTIGYGDLTPETSVGRILCILLGVVGMIAMGLIVGVASIAVRQAIGHRLEGKGR